MAGRWIRAKDVYDFAQSPFAVWCEAHASPEARDDVDDFGRLLLEQGQAHEARVLAQRYPHATPLGAASEEEGFQLALDAMARGVPALQGAPLRWAPDALRGRADVLERRDDTPSRFGDWHYVVKEIKLAKNIDAHHRLQAAFYNHLLGLIQGFTPAAVTLVNRDHEEIVVPYDEAELLATLRAIRRIHAGHKPAAVYGHGIPPWESYTDQCARDARDVSLVAGVGKAVREKLAAHGYATYDALAACAPDDLTAIKGIGEATASKLRASAHAISTGRHVRLATVEFPRAATEIFLDLEGTGAQIGGEGLVEMDYLIGARVRIGGQERYHAFLAPTPEKEADMWQEFCAWLAKQDDYAIYHYSHYERTHLKRLAERHGMDPALQARMMASMRDLLKDATASFAFPTPSNSIKKLAPYMGFSWRHKDVNAMQSIAYYFDYARDPAANAEKLQKVLDYNEDDCIAMRVVKDWLVANSS